MSDPQEKKAVQSFIAKIAEKDYSAAKQALQNAIAEKIKSRVRTCISQEK
jgi:hypothetical protein